VGEPQEQEDESVEENQVEIFEAGPWEVRKVLDVPNQGNDRVQTMEKDGAAYVDVFDGVDAALAEAKQPHKEEWNHHPDQKSIHQLIRMLEAAAEGWVSNDVTNEQVDSHYKWKNALESHILLRSTHS